MLVVTNLKYTVGAPLAQNWRPRARSAPVGRKVALIAHGFERGPEEDPDRGDDLLETRRRLRQLPVPHERGPLRLLRGIAREVVGEADRIDDGLRVAASEGAGDRFSNN